eukprot:418608-Amphidinium_carterae.1
MLAHSIDQPIAPTISTCARGREGCAPPCPALDHCVKIDTPQRKEYMFDQFWGQIGPKTVKLK